MPKPFPREFREDVVRVARNRDSKTTLEQIAYLPDGRTNIRIDGYVDVHYNEHTRKLDYIQVDYGCRPSHDHGGTRSTSTA